MFWWLELPTPLLWGFVMAFLAVVPVLGAFVEVYSFQRRFVGFREGGGNRTVRFEDRLDEVGSLRVRARCTRCFCRRNRRGF
jgi:hypothetical protein